jgi:hypothetical protein
MSGMSAFGTKRTRQPQKPISAFDPKQHDYANRYAVHFRNAGDDRLRATSIETVEYTVQRCLAEADAPPVGSGKFSQQIGMA